MVNLTTGNDTVDATTNANTLSGATVIDSSITDRDTLNARLTTSATPTLVANVENINVDVAGFGVTLDLLNVRHGSTGGSEVALSTSQVGNSTVSVTNVGANNINLKVAPSITTLNLTGTANANDATKITLQGDLSIAHTATTGGVETVTFLGEGAARTATFTASTGGAAREYIVDGTQNVNLAGTTTHFNARQVREASGYNGTTRLDISSGAGSHDLSNVQLDSINLTGPLGNNTITFRNNATVSIAAAAALNTTTGDVGMGTNTGGVANTGTASTLNLINNHASGMGSGHTFTSAAGVDILNIALNQEMGSGTGAGTFTIVNNGLSGGGGQVSTINLTGSKNANLTVTSLAGAATGSATDNLVINGVGLAGALTLSAGGATGNSGGFTVLLPNTASTISFANASGAGATIVGGSGNDTISGATWADSINAGAGNDTITLGSGADTISGGAGADVFRLTSGAANGTTILDFAKGTDRMVLQGAGGLVDLSTVVLAGGGFSGVTGFTSGVVSLQSGGAALANSVSGTGDDWRDSIQLGRSGTTYDISSGTGGAGSDITAGNYGDFVTLANAAAGTRIVNLGSGDDTLSITGATGATGATTITLGAGNDTLNINSTSNAGVTTIKFEATAAANGNDTINTFARGAQAGFYDVLDFRSFLGNAGVSSTKVYLGTSGTGTTAVLAASDGSGTTGIGAIDFTGGVASGSGVVGDAGNEVFVIFDGTASLTSSRFGVFTSAAAANAGKIAIAEGTKSVVLHQVGGVTSTVANIYYVENGAAAGLDDLVITQVGVVNFGGASGGSNLFNENFTA